MRCGCPICGTYMIQSERGLDSGCVCPACGNMCCACNSPEQHPASLNEIKELAFASDIVFDEEFDISEAEKTPHWICFN